MAVYNRIGGGMNRVTLNGKPPTERINLIEWEGISIAEESPVKNGTIATLKMDNDFICIYTNPTTSILNIYKFNYGKGWTLMQEFTPKKYGTKETTYIIPINKYEFYMFIGKRNGGKFCIYKYNLKENIITEIEHNLDEDLVWIQKLNGEYYLSTVESSTYKLYKTKDLKEFTDITKTIINNVDEYFKPLERLQHSIEFNGEIYFDKYYQATYRQYLIKFNGTTFEKIESPGLEESEKARFFNVNNKLILIVAKNNYSNSTSKVRFYKLENNNRFNGVKGIDISSTVDDICSCNNFEITLSTGIGVGTGVGVRMTSVGKIYIKEV